VQYISAKKYSLPLQGNNSVHNSAILLIQYYRYNSIFNIHAIGKQKKAGISYAMPALRSINL